MRTTLCRIAVLATFGAAALAPPAAAAADTATSAPQPNRRGADAALVRALKDHHWTLQSATDAAGRPVEALFVPGHDFVMRFDGPRVAVQGGCNQLSGTWRASPRNELMFGRLTATMKACEPPLMDADRSMAELLARPLAARVERGETPTLRLVSAEGQTLAFAGRPTPRSLYGAPTRIFIEVAAQRVPCTPALMPPTTCLQVRERRFDAKGLPVGDPGPWQAFHSTIDGYTHEPGVRNVLRVDRYRRANPPADASAYVYVLDLVVESEVVEKK